MRSRVRCGPSRIGAGFLPGAAEIRRTETMLRERVTIPRSNRGALSARSKPRCRTAPSRLRRRAAARSCSDLDRRDVADHRRRAHRGRQRARARAALRAGRRPHPARDGAGLARVRRPAARPCRTHRARRLLPAVGRAADRVARAPTRRKFSPPICPASCSISRIGASPIRRRWPSSIRRRGGADEAKALLAELGAIDDTVASPSRAALRRAAAAAAACAHGGRCGARRWARARSRNRAGAHRARARR